MRKKENKFVVRSKIWIEESSGKVVFSLGKLRILEAIERYGSMNAAAELSMSYRSVWCGRITGFDVSVQRIGCQTQRRG